MHGKQANLTKDRAPMIRYHSHKQLSLAEFDWPFQTALDENNRWVKNSPSQNLTGPSRPPWMKTTAG